jgi:delta24(24(1))-sterol reductase
MTGNHVYDFFMGATLNPRWGSLDIKMLWETRVAWTLLFGLTCSAAAHQYEQIGYITPQMFFLILAHGIYANAVHKGEECIPTTWFEFEWLFFRFYKSSLFFC